MPETLWKDGAHFTGGGYTLLNNTWGRGALVNGVDYVQTITHDDAGATFAWDWPVVEPRHVLAYPEIFAGISPWSGKGAPGELPIRLAEIDSLTAEFTLDWGGEAQLFNVSFDLWLSSDPAGGRDAISHEIMIWLKSADFHPGGKPVGAVTVPGLSAEFRYKDATPGGWPKWTYAAYESTTTMKSGQIDIAALLNHLVEQGLATPDLWLMNVELGAEIAGGSGWLRIDGFDVSVNAALAPSRTEAATIQPADWPIIADGGF
jgi:hypothetical protein